jgi:hypothetical protein
MNRRCSYLELLCLYIPQNCIQHLPATARTNLITAAALCGSETIALLSSTGYTQKLHRLSTQTGAQVAGQAVAFFCSPICSQVPKASVAQNQNSVNIGGKNEGRKEGRNQRGYNQWA